ncbi:MAG: helix-turn-helix domain-containing protein [Bacteroidota bacterium]|nr:helix-turn-helix domain-containing protein [Bacteroidota bacterium]
MTELTNLLPREQEPHTDLKKIIEEMILNLNPFAKRWLRTQEVKAILGLSTSAIQNLRIAGVLPYTKMGGTIYYDYQDINAILVKNKVSYGRE